MDGEDAPDAVVEDGPAEASGQHVGEQAVDEEHIAPREVTAGEQARAGHIQGVVEAFEIRDRSGEHRHRQEQRDRTNDDRQQCQLDIARRAPTAKLARRPPPNRDHAEDGQPPGQPWPRPRTGGGLHDCVGRDEPQAQYSGDGTTHAIDRRQGPPALPVSAARPHLGDGGDQRHVDHTRGDGDQIQVSGTGTARGDDHRRRQQDPRQGAPRRPLRRGGAVGTGSTSSMVRLAGRGTRDRSGPNRAK